MANLSNINNKLIVTDGGNLLVNATANLTTYGGLTIDNISNPSIAMKTNSASGWIYTQYINNSGTNNFSMGVNQTIPYWGVKTGAGMDNPALAIRSSGNVGIGTILPDLGGVAGTRVLTIASPTAERWGILELAGNRTWGGNQVGEIKFISTDSTNNGTLVSLTALNDPTATGTGGSLKFSTRPDGGSLTERMLITSGGQVEIGSIPSVTPALLSVRKNGTCIEYGHGNNNGRYEGTLGAFGSSGFPYIGFSTSCDNSANTFTTRGWKGNVINSNDQGDLIFAQATNANAGNQTLTERMRIKSVGDILCTSDGGTDAFRVFNASTGAGDIYLRVEKAYSSAAVARSAGIILGSNAGNLGSTWTVETNSSNGYFGSGNLDFIHNAGGTPSTRMRIDSGGSIIIGTGATSGTPSADYRSLEIGRQGNTITGAPWKSNLYFSTNATITAGSTTFTYRYASVPAAQLILENGEFAFGNAASGTVGSAVSFTERMRIYQDGDITMGQFSNQQAPANGILKIRTSGSTANVCYPLLYVGGSTHLATRQYGIGFDPEGYADRMKMFFGVDGMNNGYSYGDFVWNIQAVADSATVTPADEKMRLNKLGYLGLGGNAAVKLEVFNGSLRVRGSSANVIELSNTSGNTRAALGNTGNEGDLSLYRSNNSKYVYLSSYYNSYISPQVSGAAVGIGGTSPTGITNSGPGGNTTLDVQGPLRNKRVMRGWYHCGPITSTNAYRHIKTNLWMGGGPSGNTEYIMGGFEAKGFAYYGSYPGFGHGTCMFHNWSGGFASLQVSNFGTAGFMQSPYTSSDGYCVIVLRQNTYMQPAIDFSQYYTPYPWRTSYVTAETTSNNLTGVY